MDADPPRPAKRLEIFVRHDVGLDALGYFEYLHERNPDAANRFLAAIDHTVEGLGQAADERAAAPISWARSQKHSVVAGR